MIDWEAAADQICGIAIVLKVPPEKRDKWAATLVDGVLRAAHGDMVLYRINPDTDIDPDSFVAVDPHTGAQRALIQVWPEVRG